MLYMYMTQPLINNRTLPFVITCMDLKGIMLTEKSEKDKYHLISLICGALKTKTSSS